MKKNIFISGILLVILYCLFNSSFILKERVFAQGTSNLPTIVAHITDEHIIHEEPITVQRLKDVLTRVKAIKPDLLISTGDHTTNNDAASYNDFNRVFKDVGRFVKFPSSIPTSGIPFFPVAGNHDNWLWNQYDDYTKIQSYTIGNIRFVGFSHDIQTNFPEEQLEAEFKKSCYDRKSIVVYYHHSPYGWKEGSTAIDLASWTKLDSLMQKYPVILYMAGHNHLDMQGVIGNYLAKTIRRSGLNSFGIYAISENGVNVASNLNSPILLLITKPQQYYPALAYTKTDRRLNKVQAFVKATYGRVTGVSYKIDYGESVTMVASSDNYYEAELDAKWLYGNHTITVTVTHSSGSSATNIQTINVYFDKYIPTPSFSGCPIEITPTPTPGYVIVPARMKPVTPTLRPTQ